MTSSRPPDHYTRRAHELSYPARSVFKLEEIDQRIGILRSGDRVVDLGCSPGSWLSYAARKVAPGGTVLAVDLNEPGIVIPENARFLRGDVLGLGPEDVAAQGGFVVGGIDVVLSDMAPRTSGDVLADQERSWELFEKAVSLALALLAPRGRFLGKLFFSPRHAEAVALMKGCFSEVRTLRPRATRKASKEIFVAGLGFAAR